MPIEKRSDHPVERGHGRHGNPDDFWANIGLDVEEMSPRAQVVASLAVLIPVVIGAVLVLTALEYMWWLVFTFGWTVFPAFGLLVRGIAGLSDDRPGAPPSNGKERELLGALRDKGELTAAQVAMETSLTVAEADEMLEELAVKGHLDMRVRGGGLFYALWEPASGVEPREPREGR